MNALDDILIKLWKLPKVVAISIHDNGEQKEINGLLLINRKGNIEIGSKHEFQDYEKMSDWATDLALPLVLVLDGKFVLTELKDTGKKYDEDDFLISNAAFGECHVRSLVRRSYIEDLRKSMGESWQNVIHLSLGPTAQFSLATIMVSQGLGSPIIGNYSFLTSDGKAITDVSKSQDRINFTLEEGVLTKYELPAYGSAIQHFIQHRAAEDGYSPGKLNYIHQALNKKLLLVLPILVFGLLLVNTGFFFNLSDENKKLKEELSEQTLMITKAREYQQDIKDLSQILAVGETNTTPFAFLIDELGRSLPSSVQLDRLLCNPETKDNRNNTRSFHNGVIILEGTSTNLTQYSRWITKIRTMPGVQAIEEQKYQRSTRGSFHTFNLKVINNP
ncbi:MAG: hypothetical protein KI790_01695 [Cyclobacteriaceae bacterium]|nr:hypothetical protein [Cyclobacteriaceae bacterium HetDA_MAG_MS6]